MVFVIALQSTGELKMYVVGTYEHVFMEKQEKLSQNYQQILLLNKTYEIIVTDTDFWTRFMSFIQVSFFFFFFLHENM